MHGSFCCCPSSLRFFSSRLLGASGSLAGAEVPLRTQLRLWEMALAARRWAGEVRLLRLELEQQLPPEPERSRFLDHGDCPFLLSLATGLECALRDSLIPVYAHLHALATMSPDKPEGEVLDRDRIWEVLRPDRRSAGPAYPGGEA